MDSVNSVEEEIFREEPRATLSMNPLKFALWLFIVTICMLFAAWTSAFLVRKAEGNWMDYDLPVTLWISSGIILLSSFTMQWAYFAAKKDNLLQVKLAMIITTLLGFGFLFTQWTAWQNLQAEHVFLAGNPSGSFLYVLTGAHGFHLVTGLFFLIAVLIMTFQYKIHSKNMLWMEMCTTYWHFLDFLWIYLFIFLIVYH